MPGTLLQDDAEQMYAERLRQHAQSVWDTIANAPQQVTQAVQPAFQAASSAAQNIQPILPSIPQVDPNAVQSAQQALLQHAQDAWNSVQQPPQPQATAQAVDPTAANDAAQRLLQHANDTWQSVGQGLTSGTAPVTQATRAVTQGLQQATSPTATSPVAQDQTVAAPANAPEPDRSMSYQDYARAAARKAGIDPNVFMAQIQQESGFNPAARSPAGAIGIAQFMPATAAGVHLDPTDPYASLDAAAAEDAKRLQQYDGDWGKTLASYNAGAGAVAQYGGIPPYAETQGYVKTILGNAQKAADAAGTTISGAVSGAQQIAGQAVDAAKQVVGGVAQGVLPAVSQFGDKQLSSAEAYAACGPAAAVRFAQMFGRNPTLREAVDLAKNVGWSQDTGMAGLQSESKLFDEMNIPHRIVGADWQGLAKEAQSGNPVTMSTTGKNGGHYFTADSYDPKTGAFHVGSSGTDLIGGKEWMTPAEMQNLMGTLQGGLVADNPGVPGGSPLSTAPSKPTGAPSGPIEAVQQGWQSVGGGLQSIDTAVQSAAQQAGTAVGGAAQAVGGAVSGAVQGAQQAVNAAGQTITDLGAGTQQAVSGAAGAARTTAQQGAETLGQGLPDITGTLTPESVPGGANTPLGKIAQGQKVTPVEQLEAAPQIGLGYEQSRSQAAANLDPLRNLPGGNVVGPTVEMLTDPASWVGVGSAKNAIGVAASVAASVAAQQVADNVIPDDDPNKGVKVAIVSLLGAFTGGPVGERTIAPLVDRANALVSGLGADGASLLVKRAADAAGDRVAPTVRQLTTDTAGTQGGQIVPPVAERLGGAAAGGTVGYQTSPEDASPQERALRTAGGAVAGYAGVAAASKVARALADILKPDLAAPQLEQAIKTVNETDATAPEIAAAIDQVRKMPGTAELAPVRQQVPQSSTDLLQAMLDAARARGADPEKLTTLEQQITAMDPQAATRRGLSGFLTGEGSEAGSVSPRFGATLGGAVAGGVAGNATTPDDAMTLPTPLGDIPIERAARILAGAGIGAGLGSAAGFRGSIDQRVLESLRNSGVVAGPPTPAAPVGGLLSEAVQQSKQMLLTGPHTHISNVIGNTIELGRQPIALALGGRGDDALAAVTSVVKALPQAAGNALSLTRGLEPANLSQGANLVPRRYPIYRMLSAADAFTRTLGEYQGMSAKANQLLRDAGIAPSDPAAAAFLSSHAADLFQAGKERGAQSVFGQAGTAATARTGLEGVFRALGTYKDGLLASPNPVSKAVGAMLDFELPFSGVPVRMLSLVASRTPPGTQIRGISNIAKALGSGDTAAAQHALGEMAMESTIQFLIAQNVANGNIRGPNDVEHPNGIHLPGLGWVDTSEWGGYALPMQTMAAFAEGYQKGGTNMPEGAKGNDYLNYYGPRYAAAFNASMKPFLQAVPGMNMVRVLSTALQGNATDAGTRVAQDAVSRLTVPGMARFIENATDPSARDLAKKGPEAAWDTFLAGWPGLAQNLPVKIDPTTGEPMDKKKSGLGTLIGQQQDFASPLSIEADRLNKAGFKDVVAPTAYADGVTIGGSKVSLSPDEQREVAQITGSRLDQLAARMDSGEYQNAPDVRKAQMLKAIIADADKTRESAVTRVLGGAELRSRVLAGRQTAGQLRTQAEPPPPFDPFASLRQQDQPAAAGVR